MSELGDISPVAPDFADLFENAPCGYLSLGQDGRITRANAAFLHWTQFSADELLGLRFRDLFTLPARIFYETSVAPLLRLQGGYEEIAIDFETSGGDKLPVLLNAVEQRNDNGDLLFVRVIVFRATERRGYERGLLGREAAAVQGLQAELSNSELREQFIAVLGHDLRNPLASIVGATRLLRREALSEKAVGVLRLMETSVDRMAGLIDDVMDFARGRLGSGIELDREFEPLEPVLRQVVSELEVDEPTRVFICDFALRDPVSFDKGRLAQLVSNLLGNALTHGDSRQPVRLSAVTCDGHLRLSVANTGEPIPAAALTRLFQPFIRGEVSPNQQGLGLGLHIASEIAKAHGGRLTAISDETETRFTLVMPLCE